LQDKGYRINAIRIPPPGEHPHQKVMNSILIMLSVFGAVAAVLSAVLSATILGAILAQQTRQIGVMKAIGAANGQVARLYLVLVLALASTATLLGGYAGLAGGRAFAAVVLQQILNFSMHSSAVPHWVYLAIVVAGVIVPLLISAVPILRATGVTPKAAMSDVGSRGHYFVTPARWHERLDWLDRTLVMALRNSMRRRGRLLLTLVLLSSAGAVFLSSMNVRAASDDHLQQAAADRRYDIELALRRAVPAEQVARVLAALPEVRLVEPWERSTATRARPDGLPIERIYPDGAHGTLALAAVPASNATLKLTMLDGSWLDGRQATAVLNSEALESFPDAKVGQDIALAWKGRDVKLRVVGIARQYMSSATVFVPADTYADLTGQRGMASTYRIVLKMHDAGAIDAAARRIEAALAGAGIEVRLSVTETMMRKEVDGHFDLLMAAMLFISLLMAAVGLFGLGSAMSSSVAERGREFGIMRAIGATHGVVLRNVLCEGLAIALMSLAPAFLLALPVSAAIGNFLGNLLFGLPFPLVVSGPAVLDWIGLILCCALLASGLPAWHASRISVRRSFACL
jgi:putative ABC transport system permease protein